MCTKGFGSEIIEYATIYIVLKQILNNICNASAGEVERIFLLSSSLIFTSNLPIANFNDKENPYPTITVYKFAVSHTVE